jgi:hypothetical protein
MGVRQANDLSRVAWIGEDFLISRQAGIENNFTAAAGTCSCGAPVKNSSILKGQDGEAYGCVVQRFLRKNSFAKMFAEFSAGAYFTIASTDAGILPIEPK